MACVIIRKTLSSTMYIQKTVKSDNLTEQVSYGLVSNLYRQAHINVESETPWESIYADSTLIFSWSYRPQRVLSAPICPLSDYAISWEIAISKNLDFHKKQFLWGSLGPNETMCRAEIFRVDTSINTLSAIKFSKLYFTLMKSFEISRAWKWWFLPIFGDP
jgi:hypothetical protein